MNTAMLRSARAGALGLLFIALALPTPAVGQADDGPQLVGGPGSANYELAARFAPYKMRELVHSTMVNPRWIEGTERFWYEWENSDGKFFYVVDPTRGTRRALWDNDRIAAELTRITRDPYDGQHLPIQRIRFVDANTVRFDVTSSQDEEAEEDEEQDQEEGPSRPARPKKKVHHFEYDVGTQTLRELEDYEAPDNHPSWASVSPDGQTIVYAKQHNLWMMTAAEYQKVLDARVGETGAKADSTEIGLELEETQLTEDGEEYYSYAAGATGRGETNKTRVENADKRKRAGIIWSKDSRRFALTRQDQREVGFLWVIHTTGNKRPELETYKYDMPGEENVTQTEIVIYDLQERSQVTVQDDPWKDQTMIISTDRQFFYPDSEEPRRALWLSDSSDELWFMRRSRDLYRTDVMVADATTGEVIRTVIEDRMNTYMEVRGVELLDNGDVLWWSEQDGWAHIYRYGSDGTLKNRLTEGPWHVTSVMGVDEARGHVFIMGNAKEEGEDPYYNHLYRVNLDGSGLTLLNPGDFDHRTSLNESTRYFVDNYSRVNTTPTSALFDATGRKILDLEEADFSALMDAGYQFPEPYKIEAADGVTDIYGVMYKPYDFDPNKKYPIVEYVYPGPQTESVSKFWSTNPYEQGLAQFGMIVVTVGNRGGHPNRSKWYHNYGYGNLRDYGLADKKAAIEQLADRHSFIDRNRVGIYGHSGGGFMSTAAMLVYPDVFDVAVSSSGNHNNDVYNRWWSETHHGVKEVVSDSGDVSFEYNIAKNSDLAANLKGHLMLTTGNVDNNVHHASTHRMAEALIKANKRFDYFVFPGQRHGYGNMGDYWFWLRAEYFVKHLLGDYQWNADIIPLQQERPKTR
jgi:dipeptidyl aminopeptidase/acylaminoacyl peptidase